MNTKRAITAAVLASLYIATAVQAAPILSVDFGNNTSKVKTGFEPQFTASKDHTTSIGIITVESTGAFYKRGGGGSNADLLEDFTYANAASYTLTFSGTGIDANGQYDIKFWSYDSNTNGGTWRYEGIEGSSGTYDFVRGSSAPEINDDDDASFTNTYTADGTGTLTIQVSELNYTSGDGARTNGFQLTVVPEPSSLALLGLGSLLIARRRR